MYVIYIVLTNGARMRLYGQDEHFLNRCRDLGGVYVDTVDADGKVLVSNFWPMNVVQEITSLRADDHDARTAYAHATGIQLHTFADAVQSYTEADR